MTDSPNRATPRLLLGWFIVSLICLVPMLLHQSDDATLFGRYSTRYVLMLVAMLGLTGLAGGLSILARGQRLKLPVLQLPHTRRAGWVIAVGGSAVIALVWAFLPVSNTGGGIVFRLYIVGLLIAAMLLLLDQTQTAGLPVAPVWFWLLLVGAGIVVLALNVSLIGILPASRFYEEPILADWAISSHDPTILASHMFPARDPASGNIYHSSSSIYALGFWSQTFGVDLTVSRAFFRLLAYLAVPFVYLTARRLYGTGAALGAVAIALFFPVVHGYLYPSSLVAATNALALYCFFTARDARTNRGRLIRHFLAGFGVAIGIEGHPYAAAFAAGMSLVYVGEYGLRIVQSRQWRWSGIWLYGLGALGAVLFFVAFRIFSSKGMVTPANFIESLLGAYTHETNIGNSADPARRISKFVDYYLGTYLSWYPIEFALLVIGLVAAAYRGFWQRMRQDRNLLALTLLSVGCLGLLMTHNNPYYWIFLMPFIALLGGGLIALLGNVSTRLNLAQAATVLMLVVLLVSFTLTAVPNQNSDELINLGYTLGELLPPEIDTVAAWQVYFYGLYPRVMISTENFYMAPVDEWQGVKPPQAIIVTQGLDDTYEALQAYVQANAMQPAYCFPLRDPIYGKPSTVTVYLPPEYMPAESANTCGATG